MKSKSFSLEAFYEKELTSREKTKVWGSGKGIGTPPPPPPPDDLTSTTTYTPTFGDTLDTPPDPQDNTNVSVPTNP